MLHESGTRDKAMRFVLIVVLLLYGFVACGNEKLATVDNRSITKDEFDTYLKVKRVQPADEKRRAALLDQYVEREALAAAVAKTKLVDAQQIDVEVKQYRNELMVSRYFEQFLQSKINEEAVRAYYDAHAAEYTEKQVHVAHVMVRLHGLMTTEQKKSKMDAARQAHEQIKSGRAFAEIAGQQSEDTATAQKGGDMGWIKEGGYDPRFSKVAFELKPGEVSEPIETPFGYHVITVLEAPRTITRPLNSAAGEIRHKLQAEAQKAEKERLMGSVTIKKN